MFRFFSIKNTIFLFLMITVCGPISLTAAVLSGKISDQVSGEPVPGVNVWLEATEFSAETDANGEYLIENIPDGYYTVIIDRPNYKQKVYRELGIGIYNQVENSPDIETPGDFNLEQNYPNPFNPQTSITYFLPKSAQVSLHIYDALGRTVYEVPQSWQTAGSHTILWQGVNMENIKLPSGIYFYTVQTREWQQTKKMLLVQ